MIFLHPSIDPVIFSLGNIEIRWYGLAYVAAFLIGIQLMKRFNNKIQENINDKIIDDFFIWSIIGVIVGGRLGYVLIYNPVYYFQNIYEILSPVTPKRKKPKISGTETSKRKLTV